eukprot:scaffold140792_cov18-Tisochrysis_lutea.AAC.3
MPPAKAIKTPGKIKCKPKYTGTTCSPWFHVCRHKLVCFAALHACKQGNLKAARQIQKLSKHRLISISNTLTERRQRALYSQAHCLYCERCLQPDPA